MAYDGRRPTLDVMMQRDGCTIISSPPYWLVGATARRYLPQTPPCMIRSVVSPGSAVTAALSHRDLHQILAAAPAASRIIIPSSPLRKSLLREWVQARPGEDLPLVATMQAFVMDLARRLPLPGSLMADDEAELLLDLALGDAKERFRPSAMSIQRIVRWKQEGHTVDSVKDTLQGNDALDEQGIREVLRIHRVWDAYEARKGEDHRDRGDLFQDVCRIVETAPPPADVPTMVLSTHGLTLIDEQILAALVDGGWDIGIQFAERADVLAKDRSTEAGGRLTMRGWTAIDEEPRGLPVVQQHELESPTEEVRRILGAIKELAANDVSMREIAIVLPSGGPYDVLLRDLAHESNIPLNNPTSRSLATMQDASAVYAACNVVTRQWEREDVTRLTLSGHVLRDLPLASLSEAADLFRIQGGRGPSSWRDRLVSSARVLESVETSSDDSDDRQVRRSLSVIGKALTVIDVLAGTLTPTSGHLSAGDFERYLIERVINGLGITASDHLRETIGWYRSICERHGIPPEPLADHVQRWWAIVRSTSVDDPSSSTAGVAVHRSVDARMGRYRYVFAPGFVDGVIPVRRKDVVEEFFLSEADGTLDREGVQDILYATAANGEVILTRALLMDEDDTLASIYWDDVAAWLEGRTNSGTVFDVFERAAEPMLLSAQEMAVYVDGIHLPTDEYQRGVRVNELSDAAQATLTEEVGIALNPSRIDLATSCPYKYFGARLLGLQQSASLDESLSPLERGTLMHEVAQQFMRELQEHPLGGVFSVEAIARAQVRLGDYPVEQLLPRLEEVFRGQRDRWPKGYLYDPAEERAFFDHGERAGLLRRWLATELSDQQKENAFHPVLFELVIEESIELPSGTHETVNLRIDRVDARIVDGIVEIRVIDYKTSKGNSTAEIKRGESTQMPLYMVAIKQWFSGKGLNVIVADAAYHVFGRSMFSDASPKVAIALRGVPKAKDDPQAPTELEVAFPFVETGIETIRKTQFPVMPNDKACGYCHLSEFCRIESWGSAPSPDVS